MKKLAVILLTLTLCLGMTVGLTGCGGGSGGSSEDTSTLIIAIPNEMTGCDVQQIESESIVHSLLYEPLATYNEDLTEVQPGVAESVEVTDKYIEFVLPEGLKFSTGNPLDAKAVKASFERYRKISPFASDLDPVKSIEVIDDLTVRFNLSEPAPYMLTALTSSYGGIVDVKNAKEVGDEEFGLNPVAYGPYVVESWEQGSQITLKRNDDFKTNNPSVKNHGAAKFETVIIRFIPDEFTRASELTDGDVDVIFDVPSSSLADLEANSNVNMVNYLQPGVAYLRVQNLKGVTKDINVRKALAYAVNRDELVDNLDGNATAAYTLLSPAMVGYSEDEDAKMAKQYKYDPDQSKKILADAGWKDTDGDGILEKDGKPLSFEMVIPADSSADKNSGSVLQSQFKAIGVDAEIKELDSSYAIDLLYNNDFIVEMESFIWADGDILTSLFVPDMGFAYDNPKVTKALMAARSEADPAARVKAYEEFTELVAEDYVAIPLFVEHFFIGTKSNVKDLKVTNDGRVWISDTTKK